MYLPFPLIPSPRQRRALAVARERAAACTERIALLEREHALTVCFTPASPPAGV